MRVRSQTVADDGFDKNVAEKMPKVKKQEEFSPPEVKIQPLKEDPQEIRSEVRSQEPEVEKEVLLPPPQSREREKPLDVSALIEDLHMQLLTLGKTRRALEMDLASDRKTIFQLAQDNKELRSQLEDLNKEIQGLREFQTETLYLREENADALERIRDLQQQSRSLRESLESTTRERDETLGRIRALESQIEEKELLWIKGKLKEREASYFAEENRELRARMEEMVAQNVDLERKYEEIKRSFNEIRESLTLLRDSCKTNLYNLSENPE
jgi:cell division septum initiation protein DivIVA